MGQLDLGEFIDWVSALKEERDRLKIENEALRRRAEFWRGPEDLPSAGTPVVALRDVGRAAGNPAHPGSRSGRWLELTSVFGAMFACDAISTGNVIGWIPVEEFQGLAELISDAERYRGVRRVANRQGLTDETFDQQTDTRVANFDKAMTKEQHHG